MDRDPCRVADLSRTVSHALRHAPWQYDLEPDREGWVPVSDLLDALHRRRRWQRLTERDLATMVAENDKRRFEMRGGMIRALYGHSLAARLAKEPAVPPPVLYHGTVQEALPAIMTEGLRPMGRQYVHLSTDVATARQVGGRRGKPIVLTIEAQRAHRSGVPFYRGNELVWLADRIPPEFISASER